MTTPAHQFAERSSQSLARGDADAALQHARKGLAVCGEIPGLIWEECEALRALGRLTERAIRLNRLAALQPSDPVVLAELGLALLDTTSAPQAIKPLRAAVELGYQSDYVETMLASLELEADPARCEVRLRALLVRDPTHLGALGMLWRLLNIQCRWSEAASLEASWANRIADGEAHSALPPFWLLGSDLDEAALHRYARAHVALRQAALPEVLAPFASPTRQGSSERLRIGYLSSDFHHHATAMLIAGLLELHTTDVEIFIYSYGPRTDDAYRARMKAAVSNWRDINTLSDREAAQLICADRINVLVELKGRTYGARLGIAAFRPAPVVIHYLGYPGTLVAAGVEYLVADSIIVPPSSEAHYDEAILRLPLCYQVNDAQRSRPPVALRADVGLPQDCVVLCNFNQPYKWSERFMQVWMRALARSPDAVLWLLDAGATARENVMALARQHKVAQQVLWAPHAHIDAHLARLGAANLALDQLPCASHTTAADALWMGVPLLTCYGDTFHGRVGASLAHAAGLDELVTPNIEAYERLLHNLLAQPDRLRAIQTEYGARAKAAPLFDTSTFTKHWEALLRKTYAAAAESAPKV